MTVQHLRKYLALAGAVLVLLSFTTSCHRKSVNGDKAPEEITGGDRDEHGCIGSAGYSWSQVLNECIRIWEKGIELSAVQQPGSTDKAFLVSGNDANQKELFLPGVSQGLLLHKKGSSWKDADDSYELMQPVKGQYEVYDAQGVLLFKSMTK